MKNLVIEFKDFGFKYNAQAKPTLYNIDLTIYEGEKVLICGPSGCGKSTLAHCINGLIPQSYAGKKTGELILYGENSESLSIFDISKKIGTVLQDADGQFVGMTVAEDIAFVLENDLVPQPEMRERVRNIAQEVGVGGLLHHAPHEISGGQKQRVSLAGVMVDNVQALLFDEPLANLDPATGKRAIELIDEINRSRGTTVVIIEHRLEDVLHCPVDRIILMGEGRIVADLTPDELLSRGLLTEKGIREPLYLTALRYAGVEITPQMHPASLEKMELSEEDCAKVRSWVQSAPAPREQAQSEIQLDAQGISYTYPNGKKAVENISFAVRRGELMSVVGRNGAGKSTFSKIICGFLTQQQGKILLDGADMAALSIKERADYIGYVMQNPNQMICESMIMDEVALGLRTRGVPEEEIRERVENTLKVCGLYPFRNWPVSALSFGQKSG